MDHKALVGLLSGVSLVIATLIGVALLNMPEAANAARSADGIACPTDRPSMDRSYGISSGEAGCRLIR